jgi:hypothetical protein
MRDPLFWSLFMCTVAYLIGTVTGRQLIPAIDNMLLLPVVAVQLNLLRLAARQRVPALRRRTRARLPGFATAVAVRRG